MVIHASRDIAESTSRTADSVTLPSFKERMVTRRIQLAIGSTSRMALSATRQANRPTRSKLASGIKTDDRIRIRRTAAETPRIIARRDELLWQVVDFRCRPTQKRSAQLRWLWILVGARISKKTRKAKKIFGITSSSPSEGKSTIAASLAQLISHGGKRVILVDCDLRAPRLTRVLAPMRRLGFSRFCLATPLSTMSFGRMTHGT